MIEELAVKLNFPLKRILIVDASKRSAHSNAYYFGLGSNKRIVIFDTLLKNHTPKEIVAIVCHELGHWHKMHTL